MKKNTLITITDPSTNEVVAKFWPLAKDTFTFDEEGIKERYHDYIIAFRTASDDEVKKEIDEWKMKYIYEKKCCVFFGDDENPSYLAMFDDKYEALGFINDDMENSYIFSIHSNGETMTGAKNAKKTPVMLDIKEKNNE